MEEEKPFPIMLFANEAFIHSKGLESSVTEGEYEENCQSSDVRFQNSTDGLKNEGCELENVYSGTSYDDAVELQNEKLISDSNEIKCESEIQEGTDSLVPSDTVNVEVKVERNEEDCFLDYSNEIKCESEIQECTDSLVPSDTVNVEVKVERNEEDCFLDYSNEIKCESEIQECTDSLVPSDTVNVEVKVERNEEDCFLDDSSHIVENDRCDNFDSDVFHPMDSEKDQNQGLSSDCYNEINLERDEEMDVSFNSSDHTLKLDENKKACHETSRELYSDKQKICKECRVFLGPRIDKGCKDLWGKNEREIAPTYTKRPKCFSYSEEAMNAAYQTVAINKKSIREAARLHGVLESTLRDWLKGRKSFHSVERTVLTLQEEQRLVEWMKECARRGFRCTSNLIKVAIQVLLNKRGVMTIFPNNLPGKKWMSLFLKKHSDVSLRTAQTLGSQGVAVTHDKLRAWFEAAFSEISDLGGDVLDHPSRIFNCNKSGFELDRGALSKVLAATGDKQVSNDTQITVLVCASASGDVHNPLIIFPGQRFRYDPLEGFPEAHIAKSPNGWIDSDIFAEWLRTAFIPAVDNLPKPVVLFADGHRTHLTLTVSDLCRYHNIILYQLPSQTSHVIQPLDLTTFKGFKQVWREEVLKVQEENGDVVGKRDFSAVLKKAWARGIKKDVVISGFRAAGLYPWNPDHVDMTTPETDNDNVTFQMETDMIAHVCGETTHETVTITDNNTFFPASSPSTLLHPRSPSINPPSLALPSADLTSTTYPSLLLQQPSSSSSSSSSSALPTPSTTSLSSLVSPSHVTSSNSEMEIDNLSFVQVLDRLLDITANAGVARLMLYRASRILRTETNNPQERLFCTLYSNVMAASRHTVDKPTSTMTGDPLQPKRKTIQPPKMICSHGFHQFKTDEYRQKMQQVKGKGRTKQLREERKKQEKRRREGEEKRVRKVRPQKARKCVKKRQVDDIDEDTADKDSLTSSWCVDNNTDLNVDTTTLLGVNTDECCVCVGEKDGECFEWIGCECGRWFHVDCVMDESLRGKSLNEIKDISYVCDRCKME